MRKERVASALRFIILGLSLLGFVISLEALRQHLLYTHALSSTPSFCDISSYVSCNKVNASEWSTFLGVPIASYGIFFYLALVGLCLVVGARKAVSERGFASVVMAAGAVSTVLSLCLFAISALIIKALCILCLSLYLINFGLLVVPWWFVFRGSFLAGISSGLSNLASFLRNTIRPEANTDKTIIRGARFSFVSLVLLALMAWAVGPLMLKLFKARVDAPSVKTQDPLQSWNAEAHVTIPLSINSGAFGDYAQGEQNAPIKIVEFADFECPGCRAMHFRLHDLLSSYEGKYFLVFRNYPLDRSCNSGMKHDLHMHACLSANLARCAGEQDKFWDATEWLFAAKELEVEAPVDQVRESLLTGAASQLGLDLDALRECVGSGRQLKKIQEDISTADSLQLESTPSFWINGKLLRRASPDALKKVFDAILAQKNG
jgi:protein-disulfide isomerase/uncharacterized membrane protein